MAEQRRSNSGKSASSGKSATQRRSNSGKSASSGKSTTQRRSNSGKSGSQGRATSGSSASSGSQRRGNNRNDDGDERLSARDAVKRVREEFPELLGRPVEGVLGVERDEDDGWTVTVQVVELSRIPNSTDVLGAYTVTLDKDGELVGYRRRRRYNRSQADED
jgi:hypothetical protein